MNHIRIKQLKAEIRNIQRRKHQGNERDGDKNRLTKLSGQLLIAINPKLVKS